MSDPAGLPRRAFLGVTGLGLAAWPRWLVEGFRPRAQPDGAPQRHDPPPLDVVLRKQLERARSLGKPLLVLVVPAEREQVWARQDLFGQYLHLCSPSALADLALCELACAERATLDELGLQLAPGSRAEPLLVLAETDRSAATLLSIDPELPELPEPDPEQAREARERAWDRTLLARVDALAAAVRAALVGAPATLERRAEQVRATLDAGEQRMVELWIESAERTPTQRVDRIAALLALAASTRPELRAGCEEALARAARERLRLAAPPGAWWASHTGCGVDIEGQAEPYLYSCGMGRVSELGRRFLFFYTTPVW